MYLFIPLILILASAGGVFFIVWRKLAYLNEMARTESRNGSSAGDWHALIYDLCPEVWDWVKSIKIKEYKEAWLLETEKLLRRFRVMSLKMDRFSDILIKKIRKRVRSGAVFSISDSFTAGPGLKTKTDEIWQDKSAEQSAVKEREEFKKAEQRLILEIAKNPKNGSLYEELGDLYVKTGDYRDAKESYEAAMELSPQNEELKKKLSHALEKIAKPTGSQN